MTGIVVLTIFGLIAFACIWSTAFTNGKIVEAIQETNEELKNIRMEIETLNNTVNHIRRGQ